MVSRLLLVICLLSLTVSEQDIHHSHDSNSHVDAEEVHHRSDPHNHKDEYSDTPVDSVVTQTVAETAGLKQNMEDDESSSDCDQKTEEQLSTLEDIIDESVSINTQKDTSKVFSLTNFIKSWLNPVLQEFQEGLNVAKDKNESTEYVNITQQDIAFMVNNTESHVKNVTDIGKRVKFNCTGRNVTENTTAVVRLVNSSVLLDFLAFNKKNDSTDCILIMFYAPWCKFCARTAANFNALGRTFIQLDVLAVDAVHFSNLNARFGTVAVPNIMVFHSSRSAIRFNQTERSFEKLVEFVMNVTGLEPNKSVLVEDIDYIGPLSSIPTVEPDYFLWCAWIFVILCSSNMFIKSQYGQNAIDKVKTLWQEHQHIE